jgi:hypothetical protein
MVSAAIDASNFQHTSSRVARRRSSVLRDNRV